MSWRDTWVLVGLGAAACLLPADCCAGVASSPGSGIWYLVSPCLALP